MNLLQPLDLRFKEHSDIRTESGQEQEEKPNVHRAGIAYRPFLGACFPSTDAVTHHQYPPQEAPLIPL